MHAFVASTFTSAQLPRRVSTPPRHCSCVRVFASAGRSRDEEERGAGQRFSRRALLSDGASAALAAAFAAVLGAQGVQPAAARIDYEGIQYLGGGNKLDLNNVNVRGFLKLPGTYPTIASKVVRHSPYEKPEEVLSIPDLTEPEKETLKKYMDRFVTLPPTGEFHLDQVNNGQYK